MIRKLTLSFLMLLSLHAAAQTPPCGTDIVTERVKAADTATYNHKLNTFNRMWADWVSAHSSHLMSMARAVLSTSGTEMTYEIPVVVHVINTGGAIGTNYNPTDAKIDSMISYVNKVYSTSYSSFPDSSSGGTYMPIRFVLAKRDSACNSTTGITRNDGSSLTGYTTGGLNLTKTTGAPEVDVKDLNRWPVNEYLNIWVVNKIDSTDGYSASSSYVAGFAYVPPGNPANLDGVVMLAQQVVTSNVTLPHELGHSQGLYHVFQDGNVTTCPPLSPCVSTGDFICDTQPIKQSNFNCPSDPNPCTLLSYDYTQHNIMDYSNCQDRFTPGQRSRMLYTLLNDNSRKVYIGSLGALAPTTMASDSCTPTIDHSGNFYNAGPNEVKITDPTDSSYGFVHTYLDYPSGGYVTDGTQYMDLSCKQGAKLQAGKTYLFTVKTGAASAEKVRIYIDYNGNGVFSPSELVYSHTSSSAHETDTVSITMPTSTTMPSLSTCDAIRMRVISDRTTSSSLPTPCELDYGQAEDYALIIQGNGASSGSVSIALPPGANPSCPGTQLKFKATVGSSVTSPTYKWFVDGAYNGVTADSFVTSTIADGAVVTCKVYYMGSCGSDSSLSNSIVVSRVSSLAPNVSIALTSGNNPGCAGRTTIFTATPTNGGTSPTYQWQVNGVNVGTSSPTYSGILAAGDMIRCIMTSSASCAVPTTDTSNTIDIFHHYLVANIEVNADTFPSCSGTPVIFRSVLSNGGSAPMYQWYVNGTAVAGATNSYFISTTLSTGDKIYCIMTTNDSCIINGADTSNVLTADITPAKVPSADVMITVGNNPGCLDSMIQFTGSGTNVGIGPKYTWFVNGVFADTGVSYATTGLKNGDVVTLKITPTDGECYSTDSATAPSITMVLSPTPPPPIISLIGNMLVTNISGSFRWYGPDGLIAGENGQSIHPGKQGYYYAETINNGCNSGPSNILGVSLLNVHSYDINKVKVYPNPTTGKLMLDWGQDQVNMKVDVYNSLGKLVIHDVVVGQSQKVMDLSMVASGNYFLVLTTLDGQVGTIPVTVKR